MTSPSFDLYLAAVERVKEKLERATRALDAAGVPYAVIGGNAVAAWVADQDPSAVRTTQDVAMMVRRADERRAIEAFEEAGLVTNLLRESGGRRDSPSSDRIEDRSLTLDIAVRRKGLHAPALVAFRVAARFSTHRVLTEPDDPNRRTGIHVIFTNEKVWPSHARKTPDVSDAVRHARTIRLAR